MIDPNQMVFMRPPDLSSLTFYEADPWASGELTDGIQSLGLMDGGPGGTYRQLLPEKGALADPERCARTIGSYRVLPDHVVDSFTDDSSPTVVPSDLQVDDTPGVPINDGYFHADSVLDLRADQILGFGFRTNVNLGELALKFVGRIDNVAGLSPSGTTLSRRDINDVGNPALAVMRAHALRHFME